MIDVIAEEKQYGNGKFDLEFEKKIVGGLRSKSRKLSNTTNLQTHIASGVYVSGISQREMHEKPELKIREPQDSSKNVNVYMAFQC